ncbi:E3 ubiquitin-protein ligase makorin-like isoform X2 [Hordeum vulgare subsp. vulgare]|uniref:E3 ubiquitin-protein ligase makorin-like isoform X2 n=1 Tax=Hordeum vulgare subsp. vulgare TaxID=112509 RepID=UPI001D1A47A2|nr:E3 ubiquitin-protein ligase makorin-like isoform X2 [Hordeum vulgare subsp. vulgare]
MSNRSICKFFVNGACFKGDYCQFSHDWNDQPNDVCTFYQNGVCSYGSRCRYEHVDVSSEYTPASTTAALAPSNSYRSWCPFYEGEIDVSNQTHKSLSACSVRQSTWRFDDEDSIPEDGNSLLSALNAQNQARHPLAHLPICSFAAAGTCPYGEECPQTHGDLCTTCGKQCLHPYRPSEGGAHIKLCKRNNKRLEALKKSEEIECSVCLDRVLSKPTAAEKRFGLLPECDHAFCITCIRKWRSSSLTSSMDMDSTVKACPICRKVSYYVIPSATWYSSKEEKQDIIDGYKAKLKSIDCRYFDFGRDTCPFGGRCFYKHAYTDGCLEEPATVAVLHFHADNGSMEGARNIGCRLAYLLSRLHL